MNISNPEFGTITWQSFKTANAECLTVAELAQMERELAATGRTASELGDIVTVNAETTQTGESTMNNLDSFIAMMQDNELDAALADTTENGSTRTLAALQDEKARRQARRVVGLLAESLGVASAFEREASDYCNLLEPIIKN